MSMSPVVDVKECVACCGIALVRLCRGSSKGKGYANRETFICSAKTDHVHQATKSRRDFCLPDLPQRHSLQGVRQFQCFPGFAMTLSIAGLYSWPTDSDKWKLNSLSHMAKFQSGVISSILMSMAHLLYLKVCRQPILSEQVR